MKIYDVFPYSGEEVLEARIQYLAPVIDHFVIYETSVTQNGLEKPLFFNPALFAEYADKIIYVNLDEHYPPDAFTETVKTFIRSDLTDETRRALAEESWEREQRQRRFITEHLKTLVKPEDIVFFADADEIPLIKTVEYVKENRADLPFPLMTVGDELQYNLSHPNAVSFNFWWEAFFIDGKTLSDTDNLSDIRFKSHFFKEDSRLSPEQAALIELNGKITVRTAGKDALEIPRRRPSAWFLRDYTPLSFHFRHFLPISRFVAKEIYSTRFNKDTLGEVETRDFMLKNFNGFIEACHEMAKSRALFETAAEKAYLKKHIPESLYRFGKEIQFKQAVFNPEILREEYWLIYSGLRPRVWDILQGREGRTAFRA